MRGKRSRKLCVLSLRRITPAHAGKTARDSMASRAIPDHPRACGENTGWRPSEVEDIGSPPRMRGKRPAVPPDPCQGRITPAHAGKTVSSSVPLLRCADHPRACGENSLHARRVHLVHGSPPRMRGKLIPGKPTVIVSRITPACAGKTKCYLMIGFGLQDHPRVCGEN